MHFTKDRLADLPEPGFSESTIDLSFGGGDLNRGEAVR